MTVTSYTINKKVVKLLKTFESETFVDRDGEKNLILRHKLFFQSHLHL